MLHGSCGQVIDLSGGRTRRGRQCLVEPPAQDLLEQLDAQIERVVLQRQHPITGLLPASTAHTVHGNYGDAWVRDCVYSIQCVWGLALAHRRLAVLDLSRAGHQPLFGGYNRYFWGPRIWNRLAWQPGPRRRSLGLVIRTLPRAGWDDLGRPC
mgnify:CR=1 FL=1